MKKRIITAVLFLPFFAVIFFEYSMVLGFLCLSLSLAGLNEWYRAFTIKNNILCGIGYIFTFTYYFLIFITAADSFPIMLIFSLLVIIINCCAVFLYNKISLQEILITAYGFFYIPFLLSFVFFTQIRSILYVWLIFISAFGCDTFAYFTGRLLGKHKLSNTPSPNKTFEGVACGIIGAGLIGFIFGYFIETADIIFTTAVCFTGAFFSVMGDMFASAVKRHTGIKDFGKILPGHGGVLDRFDSVLFTAPVVYLAVYIWT